MSENTDPKPARLPLKAAYREYWSERVADLECSKVEFLQDIGRQSTCEACHGPIWWCHDQDGRLRPYDETQHRHNPACAAMLGQLQHRSGIRQEPLPEKRQEGDLPENLTPKEVRRTRIRAGLLAMDKAFYEPPYKARGQS